MEALHRLPAREALLSLCRSVERARGRALLVGGCVRDLLLENEPNDLDVEVFGLSPDRLVDTLSHGFALDLVGKDFGVLKLKDFPVDVSIPRRESKRGLGHRGFEINSDPTMTVAEAAARRDFTINSLSWDPLTDDLFDPFDGQTHLRARLLHPVSRMPGHPNPDAFLEDPLRVLRAAQFLARFDFEPSDDLVEVCRRGDIEDLPKERLFDEWQKLLLRGVRPSLGLDFLREVGWLRFFPEVEALVDCPQNPAWHPEGDVFEHTKHCLDAFAHTRTGDSREDLVVGLAVLCHDFGKPETTAFLDGRWKSKGHEAAGAAPTRSFLARLTNEHGLDTEVCDLVVEHLKPLELFEVKASSSAIRRLARRVKRVDRLLRVAACDQAGRPPLKPDNRFATWLLERIEELGVRDQAPKPIVMGRHLMDLGWNPGKHFRPVLDACFEAQLDGKFEDEEGGRMFLREFLASQ